MLTTRGSGYYLSGQFHTFARSRRWTEDNSRPGIIWCPGAGGNDLEFVIYDDSELAVGTRDTTEALTDLGYPVISLNTAFTWGNDTAMARMDAIYEYATETLNWPEEVILIGGSQGGTTMTNWAWRNPDKVRAMVGFVPLLALDAFHDADRLGLASSIETAYGSLAAYNAAVPTRDPIQFADELTSIPMRSWYSPDDPAIDVAWVTAFMAAQGGEAIEMRPSGHSIEGLDLNEVYEFLEPFADPLDHLYLSDDLYLADTLYMA